MSSWRKRVKGSPRQIGKPYKLKGTIKTMPFTTEKLEQWTEWQGHKPFGKAGETRYNLSKDYIGNKDIIWMTPIDFLSRVSHPAKQNISALSANEQFYDSGSIESITKGYIEKKEFPPLFLDYTNMWYGFPSHEGGHRAYVAKKLGITVVPVIVKERGYKYRDILTKYGYWQKWETIYKHLTKEQLIDHFKVYLRWAERKYEFTKAPQTLGKINRLKKMIEELEKVGD